MRNASVIGMAMILIAACAPTQTWISTPLKQTFDNEHVYVEFEPRKNFQAYYDAFLVAVTNKTDQGMVIDWNRTHYLLNGKTYDRFGFEGVTKDNIKNLPPDIVPPQGTFSKVIFPLNLIAWKPYKSDSRSKPSFSAGPIPAGQNGIALVIRHGAAQIRPRLILDIRKGKK